jgi:alkylated DNA repair dioxygenase AlkB
MNAPVTYIPNFVPNPDEAFARLRDELSWERREDAPRCEYYSNDFPAPYFYGKNAGRRRYDPRPYHEAVLAIRKKLEEHFGCKFEVCFLNRYLNQSDHLGWHADDSPEMDDARPIITVSLGVEREIWFRETKAAEKSMAPLEYGMPPFLPTVEKLLLGHGSMASMAPGMQKTHQHRIPKSSRQCGERISLTFRGYLPDAAEK